MKDNLPLWTPSDEFRRSTPMFAFMQEANRRYSQELNSFFDLHAWSINSRADFWTAVWDFCGIKGDRGERPLINPDQMLEASFFPDASLNFAENLLATTGTGDALVFRGEDKVSYRWSWDHLHEVVSKLQQALRALGIGEGDRIAAMMPNLPETIAFVLAAASIGAIWSSCSPDFGEQGVMDRFGQIEPKLFIACSGYWYNGKLQNVASKVGAIAGRLGVPTVIVPYAGGVTSALDATPGAWLLEDFTKPYDAKPVEFTRLPFSHPLFILFSSGTTGVPKCIVHSAGGSLLQLVKEHRLHCGVVPGDKVFYFTTCGWMMWNWLVVGLAAGATLCLYDGSPFAPDGKVLFDYAQAEGFAVFGTSAKYIDAVRKSGLTPMTSHDLSALRLMTSTGSPLSPEGFSFVYEGIKNNVQLASISGGTDIVSCFVLGNPLSPVWRGEIQGPGLGLAMDIWDDEGQPVRQEKGELVCTKAFPSMPVMFWNDPDKSKYKAAYFDRFENVWCHGDFAEWTEHDGLIIHGRSDATLNPGGVRIGTAEIYNQVEQLPEVEEALCIGQDWDDDVRVVLFVRLAPGVDLDESLSKTIRDKIRIGASPRHVPAKIIAVPEIPRTKSGKIVELAVREIVHGRPVKNMEALANPEALAHFGNRPELRT
ncbi:acetoacetate--CoA ligase (plasmid) [Agrobacterium radiobacter]|uniref:Acetyl-coenzyme A synthetase 1 n=1 Tax=Agrobacterium tumefaciens str. B6 TaxID=1183423 RepID=A0A822VE25_AGRTU|nr:acetoacetate--CoA ligase [Agrobacterium tumefaciens]MQB27884.1 acetoacetate--CoA ligase [Agrobacterium tumefaciens]NTA08341.1 acetoacetate--CoA ligase [Agrobacterium tumefaciens]NTB16163.1 acetoacetate--CoA ligase [Agrobacterium tumefaciens]CVI25394.1 Acetyl-coenzyme A synthetase 1 [Agrobacterium tumefaciens str. B6]SPZ33102.1 acetoacetate-CoA ligase [Agrobacterium tumefaciens]